MTITRQKAVEILARWDAGCATAYELHGALRAVVDGDFLPSAPTPTPVRERPAGTIGYAYDDGGRAAAGFKGSTGDCVVRAIAIATGTPYREVYDALHAGIKEFAKGRSKAAKRAARGGGRKGTTPRNGVHPKVYRAYLAGLGWTWVPTMGIGTGCTVHLRADQLPAGRIIARLSRHVVALVDGMIHDTHDPSVGGTRCVYGYFTLDGSGT